MDDMIQCPECEVTFQIVWINDGFSVSEYCPFCGCSPQLGKGKKRIDGTWFWEPFVKCNHCNIERSFPSVGEAVAWWNSRKPTKDSK